MRFIKQMCIRDRYNVFYNLGLLLVVKCCIIISIQYYEKRGRFVDTTVMGLGICIIGVIVIAVIKYQGMKYNYKAVASVLLQELLVKEHGIKSDLANRVCTEIYKVKKNDFENTYSAVSYTHLDVYKRQEYIV